MRAAGHLLATLVLVPYVILALGFLLLAQAISTGSLGGILLAVVAQAGWLIPWGALSIVVALTLVAALGLSPRSRRVGAACVAGIGAACLLVIVALGSSPLDAGQVVFLLPCLAATAFGAWLAGASG